MERVGIHIIHISVFKIMNMSCFSQGACVSGVGKGGGTAKHDGREDLSPEAM